MPVLALARTTPPQTLKETQQRMGAKVSTFKHTKALPNPINTNDPTPLCSIIELLRPDCLKVQKQQQQQQQQLQQRLLHPQGKKQTDAGTLTLGKCLLASPSFDHVSLAITDVGEGCALKTSKVHPSCLERGDDPASSSKVRDSLSLERLVNTHTEVEDKCPSEVCNMRCGDSERSKKRVRFRLPQDSDIILFCSPERCDEKSDA